MINKCNFICKSYDDLCVAIYNLQHSIYKTTQKIDSFELRFLVSLLF